MQHYKAPSRISEAETLTCLPLVLHIPGVAVRTRLSLTFPVNEVTRTSQRADLTSASHTATPASSLPDEQSLTALVRKIDLLIRNQEIIKATQREHGQLLDIVLKNSSPPEPEMKNALRQFGFKLRSVADMARLESILEDDVERRTLISYFSGIGGSPLNVVDRILSRAMTNELANQYCYKGQNEEKKTHFKIWLYAPRHRIRSLPKKLSLTEDAIEGKIKNWLRHARARKDGTSNEEE